LRKTPSKWNFRKGADSAVPTALAERLFRDQEGDPRLGARRVYPMVPPKVEYSLTEYGESLEQALEAICEWGRQHMARNGIKEMPLQDAAG
jgi:DNA-binding HxlR family transcriptional regulator